MLLDFVKLGGLQLSGKTIRWVGIILGGNFPGGNCSGWELSWVGIFQWELSWVGIFFDGSFLGGNCPVGIIQVAVLQVGVYMLPLLVINIWKDIFTQK